MIIRDGADALSPVIGKYGSCAAGVLTLFSSGSSVFLQTVTAVFSVNDELKIAYRAIDPGKSVRLLLGASLIVISYRTREELTHDKVCLSVSVCQPVDCQTVRQLVRLSDCQSVSQSDKLCIHLIVFKK